MKESSRSFRTSFVAMLLLLAGVESNPGPVGPVGHVNSNECWAPCFGLLNVRSAVHKAALIHDVIFDHSMDLLALTETFIVNDDPDAIKLDPAPPGYSILHTHRSNATRLNRGGGIALIHRDSLRVRHRRDKLKTEPTSFEYQISEITCGHNKSIMCIVYRPPSTNIGLFCRELSDFLEMLCAHAGDNLLLCGDFNCPGSDSISVDSKLKSIFDCFDLKQHVISATREHNLLDLIITANSADKISNIQVHDSRSVSDHNLVTCTLKDQTVKPQVKECKYRNIKDININVFTSKIKSSELFMNPASTTDEYASQVQRVVTEVLDEVAPFKVKKKPFGQKRNLWLSKEAREAKKRRRRLERRWKRTGDENTRVEYRKTCRSTNRLITDSRKKYFSDKITQSDDSRGRWRIVKDLLHTNGSRLLRTADEARLFCNTVARFFHNKIIDIGTSIAARLTNIAGDRFSRDKPHNGTFLDNLSPVTIPEVMKIINSMPSKSSPLDYLPTSLLKSCSGIFAPIICNLANLSFIEGHFPDSFKMAQILPLLKKPGLDEESPASYRPISNLNTLSKILEKLFAARLKEHVRLSSNTNVFQSAYRQFHSTETALLRILNDFYTSIDGKKITILVSLDLSAAFDTLDHSTMLHRLEHTFGVSGPALLWISTYLAHRTHYVRLDDASSDVLNCNIGVPQGSVLGPLLFALYVAPVSSVLESHRLSHHQYADDTQLYIGCAFDDLTNSLHLVNMCTSDLNEWFLLNGLCLNPDKSEAVFLGTNFQLKKCRSTTSLLVADKSISVSHDVKSLGVVIDEELSFDTHVDRLCQSAQYHIRALRHIRHSLSSDVAKTIACSIVGSRIDYCNSLLYGISDKNITKIQKVQNTVARVVSGHRKFDRITPVLRSLHWLPIKNRIKFKYSTIIFKTLQNREPVYLRNLISHKPDNGLRSDAKCLLNVPPCKTVLASRAFTVAAPTVWNEIPLDIRKCTSLSNFKLKLKTHFFNLSFNS